jgi:hypothetical protein
VAYNGYIYVIGGDSAGTAASTVYYSRLNADGSNSSWTTSVQPLPGARRYVSASVANGYLYVLGGQDNTPTDQATVYYAKLNTDGSTGAWTTNVSNPLPQTRVDGSVNVSNGNIYYIGGVYSVTGLSQSTVYNAPLNTDGSVGAWNTTNALTSPRDQMSAVIANGYIYVPGGNNSGEQSTVYYTSTSRLQIGANLDLVGIQGGNLAEDGGIGTGSSGGSLTAGNTRIVGILNVQNDGVFAGSVTIGRSLTASESVLFQNGTNTTSAFQVQNSGGAQLINVDTTNPTTDITNNTANNLVSNASFETGTTGWAAIGGSTLSQNNNLRYIGNDSLLIATTTTAGGDGASFGLTTTTLASNTQYNLSLYARTDHGQSMSTFEIGRADDGTTKTSCATAQTLSGNGWTRINCTFTTGTTSSTPYIYAKQTDTVARNIYIDAVTLTRVSILSNSSAEQAFTASDWIAKAGATVTRDTTQFNDGAASVKIATSVTASNNDGAKHNITLNDSTQYVLNFYAKLDSGSTALTTMEAGYSSDGSTDNTTCITGQTVVSTGWTNYMCRFTTPSSHSGTPFLYIKELNTTGVKTFYVDTVLLTIGNPLSAYREGQIALNGVITSPVALQNQTNSTTAFQIQNSLGSSLLVADTLNFNIKVYDSTGANYASISATSSSATFKSNIGTTVVGAGTGNVLLPLTNAADTFQFTHNDSTDTALAANFTSSDFSLQRSLTVGSFSANGNLLRIEDLTAGATNTPNLVYINQNNTSSTGNLILAQTGGSTTRFQVTTAGNLSIGSGGQYQINGVQITSAALSDAANIGLLNATQTWTGATNTFKNASDSASAFQIQNNAGTSLFLVNTTSSTITIGGTTTTFANLTLNNAHFKSNQTNIPTIGMATCTGTPAINTSPSNSTDSAGSFTTGNVTVGGSCVITVTFNKAYGTAPKAVLITPLNSAAGDTSAAGPQPYVSSTTTTTFVVTFKTAIGTGSTYQFYYWVIE